MSMNIQPPALKDGGLLIQLDNMTSVSGSMASGGEGTNDSVASGGEGTNISAASGGNTTEVSAAHGDTIAAISTAPGEGGIGIVRISGEGSCGILAKIFRRGRNHGWVNTSEREEYPKSKLMYHGYIQDSNGETLDEVLAVFMKGPHTYTGEDTAEIHCHGSIIALKKTLDLVLREGASAAMPGEFTKRAFLNGRLDLTQAEAVIDLIKAKTDITFNAAIQQLEGSLSGRLRHIRSLLLDILVRITVDLDYPEEDEPDLGYEEVINSISDIKRESDMLTSTIGTGRIISQGLRTVIAGKPNVGKSSLLNGLLRESRAIVTEFPGTTRDTIEENLNIKGIPIRIIDTAGIRNTKDMIERIGVEKSKEAFNSADLVLFVADASLPLSEEDREIASHAGERPVIAVLNKCDLSNFVNESDLLELLPGASVIKTSLLDGWGLLELENEIAEFVFRGRAVQKGDVLVTNARHRDLLLKSDEEITQGLKLAEAGGAMELIEFNLRQAYEFLGEIIGESVGDDIIEEVFARFCLGK